MDWIQLIGAFGVGTLVSSLLNFFVTHRIIQESERRRWIRDNKLAAFADLAEEMFSLGFAQGKQKWDRFSFNAKVAKVLLLLEDKQIGERIEKFEVLRSNFEDVLESGGENDPTNEATAEDIYRKLRNEVEVLISELRRNLLSSEANNTEQFLISMPLTIAAGIIVLAVFVIWLVSFCLESHIQAADTAGCRFRRGGLSMA